MTLYYPTSQNFVQKTLDAQLLTGATASMTLNNVTGIQNKPGVAIIDRIDNNEAETETKREVVIYTGVSGNTLTGLTRNADNSGSDQDHAVGAIVEFSADVLWAQSILDLLDGTTAGIKVKTALYDENGNEVIKTPATASAVNEVTVTNSATGNAVQVSATGGDTNISLNLVPKGSGVITKPTSVVMQLVAGGTELATGDGAGYFTVPEELNGMNLVSVHARVVTAGTTNTTDIQIANVTDSVDMLSTKITIDSGETGSDTAATAAVIDTTKDDVATNDLLRIDVDALSTTKPKGLIMRLKFALP